MVYFLKANFQVLDKSLEAKLTLVWGIPLNIILLASILVLPDDFPNYVIPLVLAFASYLVAMKYQLRYEVIDKSKQFTFQSNWRVVWLSIVFALIFFVVAMAMFLSLDAYGVNSRYNEKNNNEIHELLKQKEEQTKSPDKANSSALLSLQVEGHFVGNAGDRK